MMRKINKALVSGLLAGSIVLGSTSLVLGQGLNKFKFKKAYPSNTFKDIKVSDWYYKDITDVYKLDLVSGKGNNNFDPMGQVTLAEAIILATNIHSLYEENEIPKLSGKWYRSGVEYAKMNNIIGEDGFKNYERPATRAEVAYILSSSLPLEELKNINNIKKIPDVDSSSDYSESIFKLYNSGIIRGSGEDGRFNPDENISRAEIAALVNRIVQPDKRQKFGLGDLSYENKEYGISMTIPRSWIGNYKVEKETKNNGKNYINFYFLKDGKALMKLFEIEVLPESEFIYGENISRYNAGKSKGNIFLIDSLKSPNRELEKAENKKEKEIYLKMMEEYDNIIKSIKFH